MWRTFRHKRGATCLKPAASTDSEARPGQAVTQGFITPTACGADVMAGVSLEWQVRRADLLG